jgi:DNA-binding MarR family transcriptional regulator
MRETTAVPSDKSECNCQALRQAARHLSQIYDRHLAEAGLKSSQYSILARLARLGPLSINQLAALLVMDRTTLGRAIRPLERDKLLTIGPGRDGRTRQIALTAAGEARAKAAAVHWRKAQKEFEDAYGRNDASKLRSALMRVVEEV